jgi:hypothetical protein
MDHDRSDDLTRALATGSSRRQALTLLTTLLAVGLLAALGLRSAQAAVGVDPLTTSGLTLSELAELMRDSPLRPPAPGSTERRTSVFSGSAPSRAPKACSEPPAASSRRLARASRCAVPIRCATSPPTVGPRNSVRSPAARPRPNASHAARRTTRSKDISGLRRARRRQGTPRRRPADLPGVAGPGWPPPWTRWDPGVAISDPPAGDRRRRHRRHGCDVRCCDAVRILAPHPHTPGIRFNKPAKAPSRPQARRSPLAATFPATPP